MDFQNLETALKFAAGDYPWKSFQQILEQSPHHRWGGKDADHALRSAAADAYEEETGHTAGADLLRDPDQHVVVHEGRVRRGAWELGVALGRLQAVNSHLIQRYSGDGLFDHVAFNPPTVKLEDGEDRPPKVLVREPDDGYVLGRQYRHPVHTVGDFLARHLEHRVPLEDRQYLHRDEVFQGLLKKLREAPVEKAVGE